MAKCNNAFKLKSSSKMCVSNGKEFFCPKGINPGDLTPIPPETISFLPEDSLAYFVFIEIIPHIVAVLMFTFICLILGFMAYGLLRHIYSNRMNPIRRKVLHSLGKSTKRPKKGVLNFGFEDKSDKESSSSSFGSSESNSDDPDLQEITLYENLGYTASTKSSRNRVKRDGLVIPPKSRPPSPPEGLPSHVGLLKPPKVVKSRQRSFTDTRKTIIEPIYPNAVLTLPSWYKSTDEYLSREQVRSLVEKLPSKRMSLKVKAAALAKREKPGSIVINLEDQVNKGSTKRETPNKIAILDEDNKTDGKKDVTNTPEVNEESQDKPKPRMRLMRKSKLVLTSQHKLKYYPKVYAAPKNKDGTKQSDNGDDKSRSKDYEADGEESDYDERNEEEQGNSRR